MVADFAISGLVGMLDYLGTVAFAVTGAIKAIQHKADIFGIIVLATVAGVSGGIMRDAVFGMSPVAFSDYVYISLAVGTGIAVFFLHSRLKDKMNFWLGFDAVGLGAFSIIGATVAYHIAGLEFLPMLFAGVITAIGGGILRDLFVREIPIVLVREVYAIASVAGIVIFYMALVLDAGIQVATISGMVSATGIRLVAIKFRSNLPRAR